jgi:hypothetical protein
MILTREDVRRPLFAVRADGAFEGACYGLIVRRIAREDPTGNAGEFLITRKEAFMICRSDSGYH